MYEIENRAYVVLKLFREGQGLSHQPGHPLAERAVKPLDVAGHPAFLAGGAVLPLGEGGGVSLPKNRCGRWRTPGTRRAGTATEVLDGQQRTISFCQCVKGYFSVNKRAFHNLTRTEQEQILDYKLMVYFCEGKDKEKLDWFRIINIAGEKLTDQELRNAVYTGTWLTHAKSVFSKSHCAAYLLSKDYVNGSPICQEILETSLNWIADGKIENYMSVHQHDPNANELWTYFKNVIEWVKLTFTTYRKEMKGIDWGRLYGQFKAEMFDTDQLEQDIKALMMDDEVTAKKGIYAYLLTGNDKHLNLLAFTESQKRAAYEKQQGICAKCGNPFELSQMEADHITPWHLGGKTTLDNCQLLCKDDNRRKSGQ